MLNCKETIDKVTYEQFKKERDYWREVIIRIIALVKFLAKNGLAFRGSLEKLYQKNNGNFLGLVEMLEEFDPIIKEHVRRIMSDELNVHYLGHNIQNELIGLLAHRIRSEITEKIKQAKYYSIILDCTPDISHQEQMSIIVRFLVVDDTTGKGLFDVTLEELKSLGLDVNNMRGQDYDNGSNMKGKHQGVQKRFLDINPRAFYAACGCHSLNLLLCDMANACTKSRELFGVIQRIYSVFANSTKRWAVLKDNVKGLTLKSMCPTRWESRVDSVKLTRFQLSDVREALLEIRDTDEHNKTQSDANTLTKNEFGEYEFYLAIVIWYEILSTMNFVSKRLQAKDMVLVDAIKQVKKLIKHFKNYREVGFPKAIVDAKILPLKWVLIRYSLKVVRLLGKNNLTSLVCKKFCLHPRKTLESTTFYLKALDETKLKSCCYTLQEALKHGEESDIDAEEPFLELKLFETFLSSDIVTRLDALNNVVQHGFFPNTVNAYRVLLTIPVTVASTERSFSKLKLLKTYMRSTMSQERLNGLAMISIERDVLESIDYQELIESFASKNARRTSRFV
ncbi:uncharacterized protein LOC143567079 [Bidens hawaiensis]|uniref:uncharacterized protein LOC143567079 n=1 Tax=Bidens hawaiensis TaxID=980011 RepID=UPI004049C546